MDTILSYLRNLEANNKPWFDAHKNEYLVGTGSGLLLDSTQKART